MAIPAIILAAGASRRLSRPKQLVPVGEETLLGRTVRVARESGAEPVFVVLGAHSDEIRAAVDLDDVEVIVNADWEQGIASSIQAGVRAAVLAMQETVFEAAMLLVCDQPRLTADHLRHLIDEAHMHEGIVASSYAGVAGIPAVFPASEFPLLLALRGDVGARSLLRGPGCVLVAFEGGDVDVDTAADLERI
jgi:molybdenum cofactor cytidylyltransferase